MKKLFLTFSIALCLLFSASATAVRADDGDGHAAGYQCTGTVDCPPNGAPTPQDAASASNTEATDNTSLTLLEMIIALLPKS